MTTRLQLYNAALRLCGHSALAALTDDSEGRRLLDGEWDDNGVRTCLERAYWKFALRTQQLDADPSVTPSFGYTEAFEKSTDWVRTAGVYAEDSMNTPLLRYSDEAGWIFADQSPIFVQFVSDDASYGGDLSRWPESFKEYVVAHFASKIIHRLTSDKERMMFLFGNDSRGVRTGWLASSLKTARSNDAVQNPTKFPPVGGWVRARTTSLTGGDRGNKGSLIG